MEVDIKELEGVTLLPLADGRIAYVDKTGTVYMCGLKEEELEPSFDENGELSDTIDHPNDSQLILPGIFSDQCTNLILGTSEDNYLSHDIEEVKNDAEKTDVECDVDLENTNHFLTHSKQTNLNVLEVEDECVEQVTLFKCRACLFTASEKLSIVHHFTKEHVKPTSASDLSFSPGTIPVNKEFERLAQSVTADSVEENDGGSQPLESEAEQLLYLCVECQGAFESIEMCRQHMIQEHKFIAGRGKAQSRVPSSESCNANSLIINTTLQVNSPVLAVENDAEQKLEWQSDDLPNTPFLNENLHEESVAESESKHSISSAERNLGNSPKEEVQKVKQRTRKIKCSYPSCVSKFSNEKALQTHISCHSKNRDLKEFNCIHCNEKFVRWRLCSVHLWRVHKVDVDLLPCPVCKTYKAPTPLKLEIHMRTHGDMRPFQCKLCPKSFKQAAQLRNHCAGVHEDKSTTDATPRWYMEQQCNHCGKTYANAKGLKRHIQAVHSKIKPYVCSVCGHSSACKAMLALHLRQHTGEKPHACSVCNYRTGDHNTLRRHMMRHTGERPYKCPYCPYSAIQSNCYKAHLRNRHPGESGLFSCSLCSFQTISQDTYVQHVADHQKGLIVSKDEDVVANKGEEVEYFPGNVAAAHLVYRYLGKLLEEPGRKLPPANITDSRTSADGTTQSITIQIPSQDDPTVVVEDDESSHSFFLKGTDDDVGIDTGGITIPAEPSDLPLVET